MVCGRCHRESEDHPLSSSGPTRCEYPTHREDCPGGFKTACDMSANEKKETASKTDFIEQNDAMKTIEQALLHLNLHSSSEPHPVLDTNGGQQDPLLRLGLSPGQFKQLADSINLVQESLNPAQEEASKLLLPPTTPKPTGNQTPGTSRTLLATPATSEVLTQKSDKNLLPDATHNPLHGIEELVRHHIASNQQNLQQFSSNPPPAYTGPTLPQIRADPNTQDKVSSLINVIRAASPVFGQLAPNPPQTPMMPGISPLEQLQLKLSEQALPPQPMQAPTTANPVSLLQQLLVPQLVPQVPVQRAGHHQEHLSPLLRALIQPQQPPLVPQPQPANNYGQDQLTQLLAAIFSQQTAPPPFPPPPPPPPPPPSPPPPPPP